MDNKFRTADINIMSRSLLSHLSTDLERGKAVEMQSEATHIECRFSKSSVYAITVKGLKDFCLLNTPTRGAL